MKRSLFSFFAAAVAAACVPAADADIIAQDSFNGYIAGALNGKSGVDDFGFTAPWSVGSANLQTESGGILDGDAASGQGRFVPVGQAFGAYRGGNRTIATPAVDPPNNTFYSSVLVNAGTSGGLVDEYALVGFGSFADGARFEDNTDFLLGAFTGFVNQGDGTVDLVVRSRTGALVPGAVTDTTLIEDAGGSTFNVVMALEYNNPGDQIRYWVNPTVFNNGEAGLDATAAVTGVIPGFQLGALGDMNRLTVGTTFTNRSFFWDEVVLSSSVQALVPEPTSALLAMLGVAGIAARRR